MVDKKPMLQLTGKIGSKEEAESTKGTFYRYKIGGMTFSCFDEEINDQFNPGDIVLIKYTNTIKEDRTYHNIQEMVSSDDEMIPEEEIVDVPAQPKLVTSPLPQKNMAAVESFKQKQLDEESKKGDVYELGMAKNNAAIIIAAVISVEGNEGMSEDGSFNWEGKYKKSYYKLVKDLFEEGKQIRKDKLGY